MADFPELVGTAEIAAILGVGVRRVAQLRLNAGFPDPVAVLVGGSVWDRAEIETYARDRAERVARYDGTPKRRVAS